MQLGPRTLDGEAVDLAVTHEGTEFGLPFERIGIDTVPVEADARLAERSSLNGVFPYRAGLSLRALPEPA